jgi:uncharacterized protein DUF4240
MTTVLNVNLNDLSSQFISDLKQKFGKTAEVEIRLRDTSPADDLFSEADFWRIIECIDWSKKNSKDKLAPAIKLLSEMPVVNIYLFADKLAEKLFLLDTRQHGDAYLAHEGDDYLSVDDFLYVRCAVVAEGKDYYEDVLKNPSELTSEISFEPLLNLADHAYKQKIGKQFDYYPARSYETFSNKEGWKK